MHNISKSRRWILIGAGVLLALAWVTPALADYLGPDRTRTTYVSYCRYVQKRCAQQKNGKWEWNTVEDWDCSHGDRGCSDGGGACNEANDGARSCSREEGVREETVTYDPATIAGSVNCTVQNGWCNGASVPELALSASEPLSGYAILLIEGSLNGTSFACQPNAISCNIQMGEGDNNFNFWSLSSWGDSSLMGSQSVRVDTVPPEVGLSVTGTSGHSGWYKSDIDVSATPSDATSGVATFEVAVDGGGYENYVPVAFEEGRHTLQFRVVDQAGNVFESPVQKFSVDTVPPTIDLPSAWRLGKDVDYSVQDNGSGLASVRIVIEDEDEKFAKITWDRDASGTSYSSHIDWNGKFRDQMAAPPGTYQVWVKAKDVAGNERFAMGKVIVSEPNMPLVALPTADPLATEAALLPPTELVDVEDVPVTAGEGTTIGSGLSGTTTTQTFLLTTGSAGAAASTATSGVLWGAAAAAAIAAATSYALD
ncbi:MAG TPA: Ig-like domain repeat protein, partial [Anaerolineales bacterium]|nr:Ig-like domain repeat protein [Anaerolineales bacterium]